MATRMKDADFSKNWDAALVQMTHASAWALKETDWFTLNWFLANDENWQKCRDGNYDDKPAPRQKPPARNYYQPTQAEMDAINAQAAAELAAKEMT